MEVKTLTKKQKLLQEELEELCSLFLLEYRNIEEYDPEIRTLHLYMAKKKIIRSHVITYYTLIDEFLNMKLRRYIFGTKKSITRTKKFQNFNHFVLEELSLLKKLTFVKNVSKIPRRIVADIEKLNSVRNGLAHSFFPEDLKKCKPICKGKDIFSMEGVKIFEEDMQKIHDYFLNKIY